MSINAVIRLKTLRCITEGESGSEPYIWGFLAGIATGPLSLDTTPDFPSLSESRNIIKSNMKSGESATIQFPGNTFSQTFQDGQHNCQLILIVSLLEGDEMTMAAMGDGYQAFVNALRDNMDNIIFLQNDTPEGQAAGIKAIMKDVQEKVLAGIEGGLSSYEKFKIAIGVTDTDDFIAAAFRAFASVETLTAPVQFTLRLTGQTFQLGNWVIYSNDYEIDGDLTVTRLHEDPCQASIDAVAAAEQKIVSLRKQVSALKTSMQTASPAQKVAIQNQIENIETVMIPAAEAALTRARLALRRCRIFGGTEPGVGPVNG